MGRPAGQGELIGDAVVRMAALEERNQALSADNDELHRRNRALTIACDRFRALYERAPTPYITVDPERNIVDVNHAAELILDAPRDRLLAAPIDRFVERGGRERFCRFIDAMFAGAQTRCGDVVLRPPAGPRLDALIDGVVLPDAAGEPRHAVLAIADLTAAKLAERARREAQDEVLAIVSHDLRGPISAIGLACDGLGGDLPRDERQECIGAIQRAVARSERLIDDLLRVAHIESGRLKLERARFDVRDLARQVGGDHASAASAAGSALTIVVADEPAILVADRDRLHQVLSNLIGNALVHARGAAVELRVATRAGEVVVVVADRGPGITAAELPRVFERYRQGARRRSGAGLGLAIVKGLVEAHGGTVAVTSQPGHGARFEVILPSTGRDAGGDADDA